MNLVEVLHLGTIFAISVLLIVLMGILVNRLVQSKKNRLFVFYLFGIALFSFFRLVFTVYTVLSYGFEEFIYYSSFWVNFIPVFSIGVFFILLFTRLNKSLLFVNFVFLLSFMVSTLLLRFDSFWLDIFYLFSALAFVTSFYFLSIKSLIMEFK